MLRIISRLIVFIASKFIVNNNLKDKHKFLMIYYKRLRYLFFIILYRRSDIMITYQDIKAKQQLATECTQACLNKVCYMTKKLIDYMSGHSNCPLVICVMLLAINIPTFT
ncbi:hypothetical protein EJT82_19500 [Salmonella enterica]|nr:hypothetical protein [Salmonella enterica]OHF43329.1 hypothetical protein A7S32_22020 [Salmonella enterica subsp. diarizonae serovar 59:[k]:z35]PUF55673.1 hypothetical protein DAX73_19985 [Salmonella enterica subsp. enterica]EAM3007490.1 hypothetical protein [Salmonella enterica]EAT1424684.1 hypothetical protein [Salmonella enterica]